MPPASSTSKADVRAVLARVLLTREVGQRIPTVQDLQHTSRAGAGTVVKALRSLQDSGAVTLSSHGHQGTLVVSRNVGQLWREAQLGNFSLIMPPPGPVEQHGILEALQEPLARQGVPVVVSALAGARRRLERLHLESADAVVTSAGAFERHRDDFPGLRSLDLGESTFYSPGSLVVVEGPKPVRGRRLRVGIDRASHDHQLLTETEFADRDVEFVDWRFVSAPAAVLRGRVDAAIWHAMPTVISPELAGLNVRPLRDSTLEAVRDVTRAVLVTRELDAGVNALLRFVSPADVIKIQERLLRLAASAESETEFWPR
ncbi:YhfZ family protein [Microbacterium sp. Se63.02b]|uniref:YhfZ family protein n=1 Tax=Microbacterium sp. Se63.02b TaxID=2709304 RepID=UPI001604E234|nr:YhfZ family protein [Microbacterium sp. Se63.02b]QNA93567.1 hypothetical protein G4G29_16980 [Microbacterium sp. Se63.02b]